VSASLQWGGRFAAPPDRELLAFGASLEDDFVLGPFDVRCSQAHVLALRGGEIIDAETAEALLDALSTIESEIVNGEFVAFARASGAEDIHGAIDARVRTLTPAGESLHSGRSRNDQVATTLLLYARDRAASGSRVCARIARAALGRARDALEAGTILSATTHWQPAQPISLAFWLEAVAELFARAARRFALVERATREASPLGSGACSGSTLPLDRATAAEALGFERPSRNALDSIGDRDIALDLLHAVTRATIACSRVCEEVIVYCTPAFGYARLDDSASTGSSLMPQKRNPDPFEHIRAHAALLNGTLAGALGAASGIALSYHGDLQEVKAQVLRGTERGLAALAAFERAFAALHWNPEAMAQRAELGYTVATDLADALIARGITARRAHAFVGELVTAAEREGRPLDARDLATLGERAGVAGLEAPLDARSSIAAKVTSGSTSPAAVRDAIAELEGVLETEFPAR
jgi:argininosuccinate lyase